MKIRCLIIFSCVIRVIWIVLLGLPSIILFVWFGFDAVYGFMVLYIAMAYMIFRTWLQFKIFKAVKEGPGHAFTMSEQIYVYTTLNNAELMEF